MYMSSNNHSFDFYNLPDAEITNICKNNKIALTIDDCKRLQSEVLGREPTLAECVLWGIQGSEHCSYKSSRQFLAQFPTKADNVMVGVGEDAGIIEIAKDRTGKKYGIVISHESHNSPSQVVPYEGAATGIGGNVRDVNCMGAKVIGCADSLRFGRIKEAKSRWIHHGVVEGIAGYGNPIGVPNIGGDLYYDKNFEGACLVNVVTLGVIAEDEIIHSYAPDNAVGHDLILIGKPTDNSGFGGASFSSQVVDETKKEANKGAVQEPNAFLKRHILKANYELYKILKAGDWINKVGFKDLGAGGIACSSVELADGNGYGAELYLEKVHTTQNWKELFGKKESIKNSQQAKGNNSPLEGWQAKPDGVDQGDATQNGDTEAAATSNQFDPAVILCSETQERFMWAVPSELSQIILDHYNVTFDFANVSAGAGASIVGKITTGDKKNKDGKATGQYTVFYRGEKIIDALASDITAGIRNDRPYSDPNKTFFEPETKISYNGVNSTIEFQNSRHLERSERSSAVGEKGQNKNYPLDKEGQSVSFGGIKKDATQNGDTEAASTKPTTFNQTLLDILSHENVACRAPVYENFDKNVQGISVIEAGEADAAVMQPFKYDNYPAEIQQTGLVFKQDNNPNYGKISPYWGGVNAVVECARNVAAVGGVSLGLSDCLNFGNPEKTEQMWDFVEGVRGVAEACKSFKQKDHATDCLPVVSGNVSLYKESHGGGIPPSPVVSIVGKISDVNKAIKMSFTQSGSNILMIGERKDECGGSVYYSLFNELGSYVPQPSVIEAVREINALTDCIESGLVNSCHDISDGGLATCLAEMTFRHNIGCNIEIPLSNEHNAGVFTKALFEITSNKFVDARLPLDKFLFSQTGGFILEVSDQNLEAVTANFAKYNIPTYNLGKTTNDNKIQIADVINLDLETAKERWTNGLREKL
jgi:phosphoribosylformylglycinamidine (FGAM) synthase-like enzyme